MAIYQPNQSSLNTLPIVHGHVENEGTYAPGTLATLTAVPDPGYRFTGWTGDATGTTNPLTLTMDADKTIGATFEKDLSDADTDGLTAYDEAVTYGTDPTQSDSDNDGLSDGYEVGIGRFSVVTGSRTWAQARDHAVAQGGTLATFATALEWERALTSIGPDALTDISGLWIGASDAATEGTWTWITGEPFSFAEWATGQPDNLNDSDFAAVAGDLGGTTGKWYDYRGTTTRDGYLLESGHSTSPTDADSDDDGLKDGEEKTAGSNPFVADTDGDGLSDLQEINLTRTHPAKADTDNDGTPDAADDEDGDTLSNLAEITTHGTDPTQADTDHDGLSDSVEVRHPASYFTLVTGSFTQAQAAADAAQRRGRLACLVQSADFSRVVGRARRGTQGYLWMGLSDAASEGTWLWGDGSAPTYQRWLNGQPDGGAGENHAVVMENSAQWADAAAAFTAAGYLFERQGLDPLAKDSDGDGLEDAAELNIHQTNPCDEDSDSDGLADGPEVNTHGSNPKLADTDNDGLSDRIEVEVHRTSPTLADTDADGFGDAFELGTGFNPTLAASSPDAVSGIRTAVEFWFHAAEGVSYRVEGSTDLQTWQVIEPDVKGNGGTIQRLHSTKDIPQRYFRVRRN